MTCSIEDYLDRTAQEEAERTGSSLEDTKFNLLMEDEEYIKAYEERQALAERLREYSDIDLEGVPGAPFKTTWHELVLKRVLRLAAEGGYDKIAWATGQMQKERYNLSNATGMRDFYDVGGASSQNIPRFLSKYVGQWGAEVGSVHIVPHVPDGFWNLSYIVPGVEISETMRRSVLFDGQPRFSLKNGDGGLELPGAELVSSEYGEADRLLPNDAAADIIPTYKDNIDEQGARQYLSPQVLNRCKYRR